MDGVIWLVWGLGLAWIELGLSFGLGVLWRYLFLMRYVRFGAWLDLGLRGAGPERDLVLCGSGFGWV